MNATTLVILGVLAFIGPDWLYGGMVFIGAVALASRFVP
jgi:hypothetical protein